jgi:hypothetical protein
VRDKTGGSEVRGRSNPRSFSGYGKYSIGHAIRFPKVMLSQKQKILTASVLAVALGVGACFQLRTPVAPRPASVEAVMPEDLLKTLANDSKDGGKTPAAAREQRIAAAASGANAATAAQTTFERTGVNALHVKVANTTAQPSMLRFPAGAIFEDERSQLVLLKPVDATVAPGGTLDQELVVAALSSAKHDSRGAFKSSTRTQPKLDRLMKHLESHSAMPVGVVQTAVLVILEDAPVDLFAQFSRPKAAAPASESFKVETSQIIAALQLLREIGTESTALSQDPQLKIEAMIDLNAHDIAKQFYGISSEAEWAYWRHELLAGDPSTRHYALYGIARYYPEVAMVMMPRWARETRTLPHYRRAAIGALGLTQNSAAKPILQDLAQRVEPALRYLEQNLPNAL